MALADPEDANAGLVFRGRIAEDFKLSTGTFVRVGALRTALLAAAPVLSDAVIAGENRSAVCALAWLNQGEVTALLGEAPSGGSEVIEHDTLTAHLAEVLAELNRTAGSAARIERLILLGRPADLDSGEITDKGYINQRNVLINRASLVDKLYTVPSPSCVITARPT